VFPPLDPTRRGDTAFSDELTIRPLFRPPGRRRIKASTPRTRGRDRTLLRAHECREVEAVRRRNYPASFPKKSPLGHRSPSDEANAARLSRETSLLVPFIAPFPDFSHLLGGSLSAGSTDEAMIFAFPKVCRMSICVGGVSLRIPAPRIAPGGARRNGDRVKSFHFSPASSCQPCGRQKEDRGMPFKRTARGQGGRTARAARTTQYLHGRIPQSRAPQRERWQGQGRGADGIERGSPHSAKEPKYLTRREPAPLDSPDGRSLVRLPWS
jgi:hypothetical protein